MNEYIHFIHLGEEQAEEKRALCLLVLFLVKGEWKDNLVHIYEEFQVIKCACVYSQNYEFEVYAVACQLNCCILSFSAWYFVFII